MLMDYRPSDTGEIPSGSLRVGAAQPTSPHGFLYQKFPDNATVYLAVDAPGYRFYQYTLDATRANPDLQVDSDNTVDYPSQPADGGYPRDYEDYIEAFPGSPAFPGRIVWADTGDIDNDGVPDFADGIVELGTQWPNNGFSTSVPFFESIRLVLEGGLDPAVATFKFRYTLAHPRDLQPLMPYPSLPETTPAGAIRLWLKQGNEDSRTYGEPISDLIIPENVEPDRIYTGAQLGFITSDGKVVTWLYIEGITPSEIPGDSIVEVLVDPDGKSGPLGFMGHDVLVLTVATVNIDINRKNGAKVPEAIEHYNGSVVQIVPIVNPGSHLYPAGIFLTLPPMSLKPAALASRYTYKLTKLGVGNSPGKVRLYKNDVLFMGVDETEKALTLADLAASWKLDSTEGGVVNLKLVAVSIAQPTSILAEDTVRVSSIPCEPADGRIIFVNPASTAPAAPYQDFRTTAARTIRDAFSTMQASDNILVARSSIPYFANALSLTKGGTLAGLGGRWTQADPGNTGNPFMDINPLAALFDYSSLPLIDGTGLASFSLIVVYGSTVSSQLTIGGLRFANGDAQTQTLQGGGITLPGRGGAIRIENAGATPIQLYLSRFTANNANEFGGAVYFALCSSARVNLCIFEQNKAEHNDGGAVVWNRGMGGAIASVDSAVEIRDSDFIGNTALVTRSGGTPTLGSAGGGGDIYAKSTSFTALASRFTDSLAGYSRDPFDPGGAPRYFTGDGGSILVHGVLGDSTINIQQCTFDSPQSYGNGGAVLFLRDWSYISR